MNKKTGKRAAITILIAFASVCMGLALWVYFTEPTENEILSSASRLPDFKEKVLYFKAHNLGIHLFPTTKFNKGMEWTRQAHVVIYRTDKSDLALALFNSNAEVTFNIKLGE